MAVRLADLLADLSRLADARKGALDADAVGAVLVAAGHAAAALFAMEHHLLPGRE